MELKSILKGVELFHGLNNGDLDEIASIFTPTELVQGDLIAEQGTPGNTLFLVTEGLVEVIRQGREENQPQVLVNLGKGQMIGEMSLVDQGPRSATVQALSDRTVVHSVSREDFEELCQRNTKIGYIVMRNIAADLSFKLRQQHLTR